MLFQNRNEVIKSIEQLVDYAMKFEVEERDAKILQLQEKLKEFNDFKKKIERLETSNRQLTRLQEVYGEMLELFNKGELVSFADTSWQDGNEYGDCWGEEKRTLKMKDGSEREIIIGSL